MAGPSERPKVLVLVYSHLAMDARVLRQIRWLKDRYDVTSAAFGASPVEDVEHIELSSLAPYRGGTLARAKYAASFVLGRFAGLTARNPTDIAALTLLDVHEWDAVIANDVATLPLATRLRSRSGVLADLHEYAPRQSDESIVFRLTTSRFFTWVLRTFLPDVQRVTTVSQGIADEYAREYGVQPVVVANAATYRDVEPGPVSLPIRMVHSAVPSPARHIEVMIEAVGRTSLDLTFDLYLVDDGSAYLQGIRELAEATEGVTLHGAVPQADLIDVLAGYDLGVHLLPPINFNHRWALPNKLFDFVQARLGIVIGPSPEMARVVTEFGVGGVARDFTPGGLAALLDELDVAKVAAWKQASHRAARELSGESQLAVFEAVLRDMLGD